MTKSREYEIRTEELVLPVISENNFELVDVEFVKEGGNRYLRVYIDKTGGINIDDCELVSRTLSDKLDEEDFIEETYILEVSSPGLGRPLKKDKDFERNIGGRVEIKLFKPIDKQKELEGTLKSYDKDTIVIETDDGKEMDIKRSDTALIRLALDF